MLRSLRWLALEVKYLEPARRFYEDTLSMSVRNGESTGAMTSYERDSSNTGIAVHDRETGIGDGDGNEHEEGTGGHTADGDHSDHGSSEITLAAGDVDLILRRPTTVPRGGIHTHYAFSIPADEYDDWFSLLEDEYEYDLDEARFGSTKSLYLYDPDGNCVELGQRNVSGPGIDGIFEIVLEVESLSDAESFYAALGFEPVNRGVERKRIRMQGPMALELWEPHLGIADARGGVHVDLGFVADDLVDVTDAMSDRACSVVETGNSVVVRDPDGHHLTFVSSRSESDRPR